MTLLADDEVGRLKAQVSELTAANEALRKQCSEAATAGGDQCR